LRSNPPIAGGRVARLSKRKVSEVSKKALSKLLSRVASIDETGAPPQGRCGFIQSPCSLLGYGSLNVISTSQSPNEVVNDPL
jgi:hypothetical protein